MGWDADAMLVVALCLFYLSFCPSFFLSAVCFGLLLWSRRIRGKDEERWGVGWI